MFPYLLVLLRLLSVLFPRRHRLDRERGADLELPAVVVLLLTGLALEGVPPGIESMVEFY